MIREKYWELDYEDMTDEEKSAWLNDGFTDCQIRWEQQKESEEQNND